MAAKKKKKKKIVPTRTIKKKNPERDLAKALSDLNKIFTRKELSKKFKIKPRRISLYKHYKKGRERIKNQGKILEFYRKLQANKHNEKFRYLYRTVGNERRIVPSKTIPTSQVNDLIEKLGYDKRTKKVIWSRGVKRTAKQLGVSAGTVRRWSKEKIGRLKKRKREKLRKVTRKKLKALYGIFYLGEDFIPTGKKRGIEYHRILYYRDAHWGKNSFRAWVGGQTIYGVEDSLMAERNKFSKKRATDFLDYLGYIRREYQRTKNERLIVESVENCIGFVNDNFKGKVKSDLTKKIRKYGHIKLE